MFIKPAYRTVRALTYLSLGLFAIVFIVHGIYLYGFVMQRRRLALEWMGLMALFNFLGCSAYAFRVSHCSLGVEDLCSNMLCSFQSACFRGGSTLWVPVIKLCTSLF